MSENAKASAKLIRTLHYEADQLFHEVTEAQVRLIHPPGTDGTYRLDTEDGILNRAYTHMLISIALIYEYLD